jgi:carboxyl-terminal processing protease
VENFVRRIVLIVAAIAAGPLPGVAQSAARPAARASAAATTGADRIDSTTALATFDSAWRTVGASLKQRNVSWIDWTDVRRQLRPSAARARSTAELRAVLDRMLRRIGESHFSVIPAHDAGVPAGAAPRNGSALGTAGMAVRFVEHRLTVWRTDSAGAAARAGVEPGAVIERIDDFVAPELGVRDSVGMRRLLALTAAMRAIGGEPGSLVRLVVRTTDGARREIAFTRDSLRGPVSRFGNLPPLPASLDVRRMTLDDGRCVGVLRFEYWLPPVLPALDRAVDQLRSCAGIVLDLRGNLGGVAAMMMGVAGHFMTEAHSLGTMRTGGQEMRFVANPRRVTDAGVPVEPFAGPLAIVVDGLSASTSEMFAAALQGMTRARIFGERTAGQALPATATRLPNGDVLMHVVADFETPTGARIEGVGVTPDEPVPLTRDDLRAGRDAPLIAAVGWIERARPAGSAR